MIRESLDNGSKFAKETGLANFDHNEKKNKMSRRATVVCAKCSNTVLANEVEIQEREVESGRSGGTWSGSIFSFNKKPGKGLRYTTGRTYYRKVREKVCWDCATWTKRCTKLDEWGDPAEIVQEQQTNEPAKPTTGADVIIVMLVIGAIGSFGYFVGWWWMLGLLFILAMMSQ